MSRFPRLTALGKLLVLVVLPGLALVTLFAPLAVASIAWLVVAAAIYSWGGQASPSERLAMGDPFVGGQPPGRERY